MWRPERVNRHAIPSGIPGKSEAGRIGWGYPASGWRQRGLPRVCRAVGVTDLCHVKPPVLCQSITINGRHVKSGLGAFLSPVREYTLWKKCLPCVLSRIQSDSSIGRVQVHEGHEVVVTNASHDADKIRVGTFGGRGLALRDGTFLPLLSKLTRYSGGTILFSSMASPET